MVLRIGAVVGLALTLTGCVSMGGLADFAREMAKDPATISVVVQTPYGFIKWFRTNPGDKSIVQTDGAGSVSVKRE